MTEKNNITLETLLSLLENQQERIKIKFNKYNGEHHPLDLYLQDPEIINSQWLFWRTEKRYFYEGDIAICLVEFGNSQWLLTSIKKITNDLDKKNTINYEGEEIEKYKPFFGRVVINYHKKSASQGINYLTIKDELIINEVLPDVYSGVVFPGYENVSLSFFELENILRRKKADWLCALENQKAVYLISDKNNGMLYVGSATSDNGMLLSRWRAYIANGHACNKKLQNLISEKGFKYAKENFQFSILENYNARVDDSIILERESWWKNILQTRKFGYNAN